MGAVHCIRSRHSTTLSAAEISPPNTAILLKEGVERRLSAIIAADIVGYTRMMRADEAATLMAGDKWDAGLLDELSRTMMDSSICGFGQVAPNPSLCLLRCFDKEIPQ